MNDFWIGFIVGFVCFPFAYAGTCYLLYRFHCWRLKD